MDFGFRPVRKFPFLFAQLTHFLENVKSVLVIEGKCTCAALLSHSKYRCDDMRVGCWEGPTYIAILVTKSSQQSGY